MRWRRVIALARRDLAVALGSKAVVLPAVLVPLVLLVLLPAAAGVVARFVPMADLGDLRTLLDALPAGATDGLAADPSLAAAQLLVTYVMAPLVLLVPVMFSAVIAADGIGGEKERGTLEGLLLTPLSDREIVTAKFAASWIPAVVLGFVGAVVYATVGNLAVGTQVGHLILPTAEFATMALWAGPTFAATALAAVSLVSARVSTTQEAFQLGGVVVLPVIGLLIVQATGVLLLSVWFLVVAGVAALAIAVGLVSVSQRSLSRTRLGERLG